MKKKIKTQLIVWVFALIALLGACAKTPPPNHGEWANDVYKSVFADITFALPEGWTPSSDAFLAGWMGISVLTGEDAATEGIPFSQEAQKENILRDMLCTSANPETVVSVSFENLNKTNSLKKLSAKEYLQLTKSVMQTDATSTYTYEEITEQKVGEYKYAVLSSASQNTGYEQYVFARKIDNYMVLLSISTSAKGESLADILQCFS